MSFLNPDSRSTNPPKRIISLVPSQTELLYDLGLEAETIGITKFCVHPQNWFRTKARVGGTKTVDFEKVKALQPDLIIANKEENIKEQVEALQEIAPVWLSDISTLADALQMIRTIGVITYKEAMGNSIAGKIEKAFLDLSRVEKQHSTLYLIWRHPWMSIGRDTFIHDILQRLGFKNVCGDDSRYPELSPEEIQKKNPEIVMLSSEPFPFKEKHIKELQALLPDAKIMLVDGEMFSWYGSRLLHAPDYFKTLFMSECFTRS